MPMSTWYISIIVCDYICCDDNVSLQTPASSRTRTHTPTVTLAQTQAADNLLSSDLTSVLAYGDIALCSLPCLGIHLRWCALIGCDVVYASRANIWGVCW